MRVIRKTSRSSNCMFQNIHIVSKKKIKNKDTYSLSKNRAKNRGTNRAKTEKVKTHLKIHPRQGKDQST